MSKEIGARLSSGVGAGAGAEEVRQAGSGGQAGPAVVGRGGPASSAAVVDGSGARLCWTDLRDTDAVDV